MASDEMRPVIGYCGHKVGLLGGPILVYVRCEECGEYVGTYWADQPPPGYPALVGTVPDDHGDEVDVWARDGAVLITVNDDRGRTTAELSGERLAALRELLDRASMPGQGETPATEAPPASCGQCNDGLVEAKGCNCGSPADEAAGFRHEVLCGFEPCPNGCWDRLHPATAPEILCALPGDCPNGPEPHSFVPPLEPDPVDGSARGCCRQPWEARAVPEERPCEAPGCRRGPHPHAFSDMCSRQPWEIAIIPAVRAASPEAIDGN